ncbi:hypothetical protein DMH18_26760 [Streptomyces sp. WAC 06783]|uniref:hypothetical protein n=1 Tax=Streptomyces sp. WAC 06783 TaxID=2203211 RepID=UPI000F73552B|nr:hypothetical protein [Streptomyces sp. WAC 06783]RSO07037.1 hypothetical protein DMH18_26760 [Streptomyces sp. WAC 06783]
MSIEAEVVQAVSSVHRIESWLARHLARPLLADLVETGAWVFNPRRNRYAAVWRGRGGAVCHALLFDKGAGRIVHYGASHADADCGRPVTPVDVTRLWLPAEGEPAPCAPAVTGEWRRVLRTSSALPVQLSWPAITTFITMVCGQPVAPEVIAPAYEAAADRIRDLQQRIPARARRYRLVDDGVPRLPWCIEVRPGLPKPVAVSVRPCPQGTASHLPGEADEHGRGLVLVQSITGERGGSGASATTVPPPGANSR